MAHLYTQQKIRRVLRQLKIAPEEGVVRACEAVKILAWRAREEFGCEHPYPVAVIRQHVKAGHLAVAHQKSPHIALYRVEDIFALPIAPQRAHRHRHPQDVTPDEKGGRQPTENAYTSKQLAGAGTSCQLGQEVL